jgi:hypothetical protein
VNKTIYLFVLAAGCASEAPREMQTASIEGLEYAVPADWENKDQSDHQTKIVVWSPTNNPRKESVTIVRTRAMPALVHADFTRIEQLLTDAQGGLSHANFGRTQRVTTKRGLIGAEVTGTFVATTKDAASYRRFHAVVVEGDSLVHVLYTARDANRDTFDLVLESITRKES